MDFCRGFRIEPFPYAGVYLDICDGKLFLKSDLKEAGEGDILQGGGQRGVFTNKLHIEIAVIGNLEKHRQVISKAADLSPFDPWEVLQHDLSVNFYLFQSNPFQATF